MKETVLLFNVTDKQRLLKMEMALFPQKVRLKKIKKEDYAQPLGYLAEVPDSTPSQQIYEGEELAGEMILFAFFDDQKLNQVLAALRKNGVNDVPYKAILTPTNQHWTPTECFDEIKREHEAMHS